MLLRLRHSEVFDLVCLLMEHLVEDKNVPSAQIVEELVELRQRYHVHLARLKTDALAESVTGEQVPPHNHR
jgi:hypothetical protein